MRDWLRTVLVLGALGLAILAGAYLPSWIAAVPALPSSPPSLPTTSPTPTAAVAPLSDPFAASRMLSRAGFKKEAIDAAALALPTAVNRDPGATLPPEIVTLIADPAVADTFAVPRALARGGFDVEARAALKKQLESTPGTTVPPDLAYLSDRPLRDPASADPWNRAIVLATNGAAILAGIAAVFLVLIPMVNRMSMVRLQLKEFDGEADLKQGKAMAAIAEAELLRLRREGGSSSLQMVGGPDAELKIPDPVKDLAPQVKLVSALLDLLPHHVYTLTATLLPRTARGVGLVVSIGSPGTGRVRESATLWEDDFDPSYSPPAGDANAKTEASIRAYSRLALAGASWATYQEPLRPRNLLVSGYWTEDWRSYAAHRVAVSWQECGDEARAAGLYHEALRHDPANVGALYNLGTLEYDSALDHSGFTSADNEIFKRGLSRIVEARRLNFERVRNRRAPWLRSSIQKAFGEQA